MRRKNMASYGGDGYDTRFIHLSRPLYQVHLYLHIPFCHHICPYCGFYKHTPGKLANRAFVDAILAEAEVRAREIDEAMRTVYFGGGTPSMLSASLLERLCDGLREVFELSEVGEWTMEANPATYDVRKARRILATGITRISLGVQSFDPDTLTTLGRDHSPEDAITAFHTLREAGFQNISIDQMFSIPGQTLESWSSDLEKAIALQPDHISAYNLTYEEDTEFLTRHETGELDSDEDRDADFFYHAIDRLETAGYRHYEISNYARDGYESQHNRAYWAGADYLGLGPGAVSTIGEYRWKTRPDTAAYVSATQSGIDTKTEIETLTKEDRRLEAIALQLRTREGIPLHLIQDQDTLDDLISRSLLRQDHERLVLTKEGKALADPIAAALV